MKAVVYEKYGSPDVLELRDIATPVPGDKEVLVRVHAVSINDWDWGNLLGSTLLDRLLCGLFKPRRQVLGSDIAGRVAAVGAAVTRFKPGDDVFGDLSGTWGGFAEYACADELALAPKPVGMSYVQAASIPQAGMLAVQGLVDHGHIRDGQKVLINGAGGGVGTIGIQIAKLHGVHVTGVDSAGKLDLMRSLGFDHVIDYALEDFTEGGERYDLILDARTSRSPFAYARVLKPQGRYVTVGGSLTRLLQIFLLAPFIARTSKKRLSIVALKPNKDLAYLSELFEAGKFNPVIDTLRTLREAPEAMRYFGAGKHRGKVVITLE